MKAKGFLGIMVLIISTCLLISCQKNNIDELDGDTIERKLVSIDCQIGDGNGINVNLYDDCEIITLVESKSLSEGDMNINLNQNECVQSVMVGNDNGEIFLMSRTPISERQSLTLDVESTTIALVMLHPVLSPLTRDSYDEIKELIKSNSYYQDLYIEIEKLVNAKKDILDENNVEMVSALGNLIEELFNKNKEDVESSYNGDLSPLNVVTDDSRAKLDNAKIYPLSANVYGDKLILRNTNLTPSYYGTMRSPSGTERPIVIPACGDWGWFEWITQDAMRYGSEQEITFVNEGEYRFYLSRTNEMATIDFYARLTCCVLSTIGLPTTGNNSLAVYVCNRCTAALGSLGSLDSHPVPTILSFVTSAVCDYMKMEAPEDFIEKAGWKNVQKFGSMLGRSLFLYNVIKGSSNIINRIAYALESPEELEFCLCYYDYQITTCTTAKLFKAGGDEQVGYANQRLLLPLKAYVQTLGDDGLYHESSNYHKVKFEVVSGGGFVSEELVSASDGNVAETYWWLGEEAEKQIVKATVIDMITNQEISPEPIYFTATLSNARITIRLDWSQHSGDTDIDLHVIDPYGERICFYNMSSSSGGYLDRDDTHGPGPEHIRWINAPAGNYKIYVHYYPNEDEDKSVVQYTVTVSTDKVNYRPVSDFISYDAMVPVGQFTIGDNQTRSILSSTDSDNIDEMKKDIKKNQKK